MGDARQVFRRDAGLELLMKHRAPSASVRRQRAKIGIARSVSPNPFKVPLDLARARQRHRRQADRHSLFGIVMGMNAQIGARQLRLHFADDGVCGFPAWCRHWVAQHDPLRARILRARMQARA